MVTRLRLALMLAAITALGGCTLVVGGMVDPLEDDRTPDMVYDLVAFEPHVGQLTELFLVSDDGLVQARAIYDPLPAADVRVVLRNVVETNVRRVDFYSDLNENRVMDPSEPDPIDDMRRIFPDHMWRDTLMPDGTGSFRHSTNFTDIVTDNRARLVGGPFSLVLRDVEAFVDQPARVSVIDLNDREVIFYQLGSVPASPLDLRVPGMIDDGTEYRVEIRLGTNAPVCALQRGNASGLSVDAPLQDLSACPN